MVDEKICEHIKKLAEVLNTNLLEIYAVDQFDRGGAEVIVECHECDIRMDLTELVEKG